MRWRLAGACLAAGLFFLVLGRAAAAAELRIPDDLATPRGAAYVLGLLTLIALGPSLLVMLTSFTRIAVVLSLLRGAVASPQVPPNQVVVGLALFLTVFVMAPTLGAVNRDAVRPYLAGEIDGGQALARAEGHLREFMLPRTRERTLKMFLDYAGLRVGEPAETPMAALVPAFVVSELQSAFEMGFLMILPFLVIDLAVGTVLMSFGMIMLPPVMVSMPLKVLVFLLAGGWDAVVGALLSSYK